LARRKRVVKELLNAGIVQRSGRTHEQGDAST
jgi:predicted transcriptional regulator